MWLQGQHQTQARSYSKLSNQFFLNMCFFSCVFILVLFFTPGGGDVKIESHKLNIKAKSKVGSMDNVGPGNGQTNGHKVKLRLLTCLLLLTHCAVTG